MCTTEVNIIMKKRISIFVIILVLVFPVSAFANDGGPRLDDINLVSIKYDLKSEDIQIGGTFDFTLELTNNTSYPISYVIINKVFENDGYYYSNSEITPNYSQEAIAPGEKVTYEVSANVPYSIDWYKKDGSYYCDFDLTVLYDATYYDKNIHGEANDPSMYTWAYINPDIEPVPLEITNLFDGSGLAELSLDEKETVFYFPDHQLYEMNIYNGELSSEIYNYLTITNKSDATFSDVHMYNLMSGRISEDSPTDLIPGGSLTANIVSSQFIIPENIKGNLRAKYKAIFKYGDSYYALDASKEYPAEMINCPLLSYDSIEGKPHSVLITNISDTDYENLYIDFGWPEYIAPDNDTLFEASQLIDVLKAGESIEVACNNKDKYENNYLVGLIKEGKLFYWDVDMSTSKVVRLDDYVPFYYYLSEVAPDYFKTINDTNPSSEQTSSSAPSPTDVVTTSPAPPSASPSPAIEVTGVKKSSSIPFWVWYVLAVAVTAGAVLIIVLRKRHKDKFE